MTKNKPLNIRAFNQIGWRNVALLSLAIFYIIQFGMDLFVWKIMCVNLAQDYCGYWSAAKIANESGYAESLNSIKLAIIQRAIIPQNTPLNLHGFPYLPIFILPFQLLSFLGPYAGYWIWTIINLIGFIDYIRYFTQRTTQKDLDTRLLFMVILSLPFFLNIFLGQVNLWLTICVGEHLRALSDGKQFVAGAWLAGLLLKPQYLVIIGLVLLVQRYGKILAGLTLSSLVVIGLSLLVAGVKGFQIMIRTWLGLGTSNAESFAAIMMNWRMVVVDLAGHIGTGPAWAIAGAGAIVTFVLMLYIWKHPIQPETSVYVTAFLGALAASTALAWHSNTASAVILIAPIIYISQKSSALHQNILASWVFIPPAINFIVLILAIFFQAGMLPGNVGDLLDFLNSAPQLGVNIVLLVWAAVQFRNQQITSAQI